MITTAAAPDDVASAWLAAGAKVQTVAPAANGVGVDLRAALELLAGLGVLQALVEGGAQLAGALLDAGLVDRLVTYVAPTILGADGRAAFGLAGPATIADAARLQLVDVTRFGDDVRLVYESARLMFTGIVEELGRVQTITPNAGGRAARDRGHAGARRRRDRRVDRGERLLCHRRRAR